MYLFIHIVTIFLLIVTAIFTFPINWAVGLIPVLVYLFILRKNTLLLVYKELASAAIDSMPVTFDKKTRKLFSGREMFVHAVMQLLIAIMYSSILNLLLGMWASYVSIVNYNYLKYK